MKIYLTGGSGALGKEVLKLMPEAIPLLRKSCKLKNEKVVDFENIQKLKKILSDCDILIHLAGCMKFNDEKALYAGNVLLTKNLLSALPKNAKIIYASSVSVYGKEVHEIIDENTCPNPDSAYAKTKYEAEKMIAERKNSVALRISAIYGPQYPVYAKFLKLIKKGKMVIFGNGENLVSFVHVQDAATAIKNAIGAKPGIYVIAGPAETQEKIFSLTAKELGTEPPKFKIPIALALLFAGINEKIALFTGRNPSIMCEHIRVMGKNRIFNFSKAEKELKFKPRSLEKGIKEIISIYKDG